MRKLLRISAILVAFLIVIAAYTIYDNNRVVLATQEVQIRDLPPEFEGFTILQISDLHSKRFGKHQENLLSKINQTQYDMLVITGDMQDGSVYDSQPFYELLDGIENREYAFYTSGNTGPWGFDPFTGKISADGLLLESKGIHNLNQVYAIQRGDRQLYVFEFSPISTVEQLNIGFARQELANPAIKPEDVARYQAQEKHALQLIGELEKIQAEDVLIGVTHGPFSIDSVSTMPEITPPYDLVLAGHYHGGQFRLPLLGALYIPDGASETGGFFPPQDRASGLKDWGSFQQYISRGLGSSGSINILNFRLFNTPEINLITLVAKNK